MNYLAKLTRIINCRQKKQKINGHISFALGAAVGGAAMIFFTENCYENIRSVTNRNIKDLHEDLDEDVAIKRAEIKETVEKVDEESLGDVGVAMEKALEDLEDHKQNENEATK